MLVMDLVVDLVIVDLVVDLVVAPVVVVQPFSKQEVSLLYLTMM